MDFPHVVARVNMESNHPLIQSIIDCAYTVAKELGHGFSDEVYAKALALELRKANLKVAQDTSFDIVYDGICVGNSKADLIVEERVIVDVTIEDGINAARIAQCRNDFKAARMVSGLIISFGYSRIEVKRVCEIAEEGAEHWVTDVIEVV